jgi:selenocysteine-specific elongation factor
MKDVVIGTAGHIDHGKSALVMALTGINPDRLEEEKRRGITIDLGFAHMQLGDGVRAAFIDVPGHERFVKNMLAGATGIDAVLLVIAADESIKPQTREHFDICRLLGVRQGLVAITKADLVDRDILDLVRLEIQEFVAGSFLEGAPVVAVSARTGEGLDILKAELQKLSLAVASKPVASTFRLPVDRAFVMKGFGPVVTGTLLAGKIEKEAEVQLYPLGRRARVRGIEVHGHAESVALAGQRTALNLGGVGVQELRRGMILAPPSQYQTTALLDCSLGLLPSARPLRNRATVHFHCWTSEGLAQVVLLEAAELKPGERAYAQLRLTEAGLYLPGDRFIIRQFSPVITIGGGTVLDNLPEKHRPRDPLPRRFLQALEASQPDARLEMLVNASGEVSLPKLVARTGWSATEVLRLAAKLEREKKVLVLGQPPSQLLHHDAFECLSQSVLNILDRFHHSDPLREGMPKEELRSQARFGHLNSSVPPSPASFDAVLQSLARAARIQVRDQLISLSGRGVVMTSEEFAAKQEISQAFETAGLRVPAASEVLSSLRIDRGRAEKILQLLLKEKALVKIAEGLIFHKSALENLRSVLARRKQTESRITVPVFKELTGVSRKYAIPLLEFLDRERVTRRSGDERIIL